MINVSLHDIPHLVAGPDISQKFVSYVERIRRQTENVKEVMTEELLRGLESNGMISKLKLIDNFQYESNRKMLSPRGIRKLALEIAKMEEHIEYANLD